MYDPKRLVKWYHIPRSPLTIISDSLILSVLCLTSDSIDSPLPGTAGVRRESWSSDPSPVDKVLELASVLYGELAQCVLVQQVVVDLTTVT